MKEYTIFLSYKDQDGERAEAFRDQLLMFADHYLNNDDRKVSVFLARDPDCLRGGEQWRQMIHERVRQTDAFLLFYTTPNAEWQWCMYEAGLFSNELPKDPHKLLVCLHTLDIPVPSPLDHLQAVAATEDRINAVVHEIISRIGLARVPGIRYGDELQALGKAALQIFAPYDVMKERRIIQSRSLLPRMTIRGPLTTMKEMECAAWMQTTCVTVDAGSASMFSVPSGEFLKYEDFSRHVRAKMAERKLGDPLKCLNLVIEKVIKDLPERPSNAIVIIAPDSADNKRVYRMVITDVRSWEADIEFDVAMIELMDDRDDNFPLLNQVFKIMRILHSFEVEAMPDLRRLIAAGKDLILPKELVTTMSNINARFEQFQLDRTREQRKEMTRHRVETANQDQVAWFKAMSSLESPMADGTCLMTLENARVFVEMIPDWLIFYSQRYITELMSKHLPGDSQRGKELYTSTVDTCNQMLNLMKGFIEAPPAGVATPTIASASESDNQRLQPPEQVIAQG